MIADEHRQVQGLRAAIAGFLDAPVHQLAGDSSPVMLAPHIELVDEHRRASSIDRKLHRPDLDVAGRNAGGLGDPHGERGVGELPLPVRDPEARAEGFQVFGPIKVAESLTEDRVEDFMERRRVSGRGIAIDHWNPAGARQSGE